MYLCVITVGSGRLLQNKTATRITNSSSLAREWRISPSYRANMSQKKTSLIIKVAVVFERKHGPLVYRDLWTKSGCTLWCLVTAETSLLIQFRLLHSQTHKQERSQDTTSSNNQGCEGISYRRDSVETGNHLSTSFTALAFAEGI